MIISIKKNILVIASIISISCTTTNKSLYLIGFTDPDLTFLTNEEKNFYIENRRYFSPSDWSDYIYNEDKNKRELLMKEYKIKIIDYLKYEKNSSNKINVFNSSIDKNNSYCGNIKIERGSNLDNHDTIRTKSSTLIPIIKINKKTKQAIFYWYIRPLA